ncbi:MAG: hypothetical protein ACPGTU_05200 [Myxococcota bacterium]
MTRPRMPKMRTGSTPPAAWAAIAALGLSIVLTWPVSLYPTDLLLGHPGNDTWNHVWGYWWVAEELSQGRWPEWTDLLVFPKGGSLYFIDTVQAIITFPVQKLVGPAMAFNLTIMFGLALAAWGAWLLAWHVTGDAISSALAMVLYGASPHLLGQAYNGISETVCAGWLPIALWALIRFLERPVWKRALLLGLTMAITMLTSWYYGLFAVIATAVIVSWRAVRQPWIQPWVRSLVRLGGAAVTGFLLVMPLLMTFRSSLDADDALVTRDPEFVEASLLYHNITDIVAFFKPSKIPSPDLLTLYGEELVIVIYLGWVGIMLCVYAVFATRRHREFGPWIWLGLFFFIFSLGPYLNMDGEMVEINGRRIPLPFLPLFDALPLFSRISHPFRFVVGVSLAMSLVAVHGLRHMTRHVRPNRRALLVALLSVLVLVEFRQGSPASMPIPTSDAVIPAAYKEIGRDPEAGAVLDLPLTVPNLERAIYVWYQTEHGRPVPWGLNDPMPDALLRNRLTATLMRLEAHRAQTMSPQLPELDLVVGARTLQSQGYRYIVLHERLYPEFKRSQVEALLTGLFGTPRKWTEDGLQVYTL